MINRIKKYFNLLWIVLKYGQWLHSGENFNKNRNEGLKELKDFIPVANGNIEPAPSIKNAFIRNLVSQLSFLKQSFQSKGGHLATANLAYIRIPKSASTSLGKSMLEKIYPELKQKTVDERQINYLVDKNLQLRANINQTYFTIVRNPFSRLVSVYRSFFEKNSTKYIYRDYLFGILPQNLSFDDFVSRVACIPDRLKDQHIKPQHNFIEYYNGKGINVNVFKLEEPEKIDQFLGLNNLQLLHLNSNEDRYDYQSYFSANSFKLALEIYKSDIDQFGYKAEVESLKMSLKTVH